MNVVLSSGDRLAVQSESAIGKHRWWILGVCALGQLMVVLDATIVNIALPSAQRALGFSTADRQWVVTAYSLTFGSLLLLGGRLADLLGRRRTLIIGVIGFAGVSAFAGAATSFDMLVLGRAVQGAFGALFAPAVLSTLASTFTDPSERGKAFGVFGAVAASGGAVGLILGGALTEYLDWRWCLYVNDVLAVIVLAGALAFLPKSDVGAPVRLDWPGVAAVVGGLVGIVYGFSSAETRGWASPITIGMLFGGVLLLAVFVFVERRVAHPLLPLRIVADRNRAAADIAILVASIGMFGVFMFLSYYLQETLRYSPIDAGVAFLPMVGMLMVTSPSASALLLPRTGPRPLAITGMLLAAVGLFLLAQLGVHSSYVTSVLPALILIGGGLGLFFGPSTNTATYRANPADAGVTSAMVNTGQQVGAAVGVSLLNTVAASATAAFLAGAGLSQLAQTSATVHGDDIAFLVAAALFLAGAIVAGTLFRKGRLGDNPIAPATLDTLARQPTRGGRQ